VFRFESMPPSYGPLLLDPQSGTYDINKRLTTDLTADTVENPLLADRRSRSRSFTFWDSLSA
jgi:hypothetical protein